MENKSNMYDELKAWADKWGVNYKEQLVDDKWMVSQIYFESITYYDATFSYNPKTGDYNWYGGD